MKRKIIFSLVLILLSAITVIAQTHVFQAQPKGSKKWGYANLRGEMIVEPLYKISTKFSAEGYALVSKGKLVLINLKGEIIPTEVHKITPATDFYIMDDGYGIHAVEDGYLVTKQSGKWGALGADGKIKIQIIYDRLTDFSSGYALAERGKTFYVLDKNGTEYPLEAQRIKEIKHFSEGLGIIEIKGEFWGFVDGTGKTVIEPQFKSVGYFNGGLAWARNDKGKIGFINKKGNWVIEPQFEKAKEFDAESGMAMVIIGDVWGYVNTEGKTSIFEETSKTYKFSEGRAIGKKKGKFGYFNNKGIWAVEPQFDAAYPFSNGYAAVEYKDKWGIIDKEGNWVVHPTFNQLGFVTVVK